MSEIKFACPHCAQHIVCDEMYCGERITCPGCQKIIYVPERSAFIPLQAANMNLEVPVAAKERQPVHVEGLDLLSEKEWAGRASENGTAKSASLLPLWILLFLPFVVALVVMTQHASPVIFEYCFVICALVGGFYLAMIRQDSGVWLVVKGLLYAIAGVVIFVVVAVGLLFVGCLVLLNQH